MLAPRLPALLSRLELPSVSGMYGDCESNTVAAFQAV